MRSNLWILLLIVLIIIVVLFIHFLAENRGPRRPVFTTPPPARPLQATNNQCVCPTGQGGTVLQAGPCPPQPTNGAGQNTFTPQNNGVAQFQNGAAQFQNGAAQFQNGTGQFQNGFAQFQNGAAQFQNGTGQLQSGFAQQGQNGMGQFQNGTGQLQSGFAQQGQNGNGQFQNGTGQFQNGTGQFQNGFAQQGQGALNMGKMTQSMLAVQIGNGALPVQPPIFATDVTDTQDGFIVALDGTHIRVLRPANNNLNTMQLPNHIVSAEFPNPGLRHIDRIGAMFVGTDSEGRIMTANRLSGPWQQRTDLPTQVHTILVMPNGQAWLQTPSAHYLVDRNLQLVRQEASSWPKRTLYLSSGGRHVLEDDVAAVETPEGDIMVNSRPEVTTMKQLGGTIYYIAHRKC